MLVCNVSDVLPRTIAAAIAEAVTARDATTTAGAVFTALVDDPTSVVDIVDAYLGENMFEAASATDTVDVIFAYTAGIDEAATATDTVDTIITAIAARDAMLPGLFVNSDGTSRQANADGMMVNL